MTLKEVCREIANEYVDPKYARNFEAVFLQTQSLFGFDPDEEFLICGYPATREEIEEFKRSVVRGCLANLMDEGDAHSAMNN